MSDVQQRYERALESLTKKLKQDRLIQAIVICGSLAHDKVWEKSDLDIIVVTTDDLKQSTSYSLFEDDINAHIYLLSRSSFVTFVQGGLQGSFMHSLLAHGRMVFSRDESLPDLFATLRHLGGRDKEIAMLRASTMIFPSLNKAEKWLYAKNDPIYCFFWIMKLVDFICQVEVLSHGEIPGREVIQQAKKHHFKLLESIYDNLIEQPKTKEAMRDALEQIRHYLLNRKEAFAPILDYLNDAGGPRSTSEITHDFKRQMSVEYVDLTLEWMAEQGMIRKLSMPCRLLPKSRVSMEENAYTVIG